MSSILLVHGAFCQGWVWEETVAALRSAGHRAEVIDLPSSGSDADRLGDLRSDVAAVTAVIEASGEDVVLVAHSSGGMVLTDLADHPAVRHGVYLAAFWPQAGQSLADLLGGQLPEWTTVRDDRAAQVSNDADIVRETLCQDVDRTRFLECIYPRYVLSSLSSLASPSMAPDPQHQTSYIICEHDRTVPPEAQEAMATAADHVYRLPSSHSPMLSMPQQLAVAIAAAMTRA